MKIWRRGKVPTEVVELFNGSTAELKPVKDMRGTVTKYDFTVEEGDPVWNTVRARFPDSHFYTSTEFSRSDILASEFLFLYPGNHLPKAYGDLNDWDKGGYIGDCAVCGCGWRHEGPYIFPGNPPRKYKGIVGLEGGFSMFVYTDIDREVLDVIGANTKSVIAQNGNGLSTVREIFPVTTADQGIVDSLTEKEVYRKVRCENCSMVWHKHYTRGMVPIARKALKPVDLQWSNEWWGNGRTAWKMVIVSRRFAKLLLDKQIKWIDLRPMNVVCDG